MKIDGINYTLLKDYDKGKYKHLTFAGKTVNLKERVNLIVIRPCDKANRTALKSDLGLIVVTGICAAISAAGTFLNGGRAPYGHDRRCFTDFIHKYMDPFLRQKQSGSHGQTWINWLYGDVRCGLSHNFTIETGGIEYQVPMRSYGLVGPHGPEMNPKRLLKDFEKGFVNYLADVTTAGLGVGLGGLFERRFDEICHD